MTETLYTDQTGSGLNLRLAGPGDAELLSFLGGKTFFDTFSPYHDLADMQAYITKAYHPDAIKKNLETPEMSYHIAESEKGQAIGYTKLIKDVNPDGLENCRVMELEKIYVLQDWLDKKAGALLMQNAIQFSENLGYNILYLGVWQENHRALRFYEKFGFKTFGTRTFALGSSLCDDFLMKLELTVGV